MASYSVLFQVKKQPRFLCSNLVSIVIYLQKLETTGTHWMVFLKNSFPIPLDM